MVLKAADENVLPKNPFIVGRSIEKYGKIEGAFYEKGQGWYVLKIRNKDQSRELMKLTELTDGTPIKIELHPRLNKRKFVVTCPEVEGMEEKELLTELSPQKIIDVRRITKKTSSGIEDTNTLILTISSTIIPEYINFGPLRVRTRLYYPLPLLCRTCLKYGHPKSTCTASLACNRCSSPNHDSQKCKKNPFCGNCNEEGHSPTSRTCPIWTAETAALKLSTDKNISPAEARKILQQTNNNNTYANILKSIQPRQETKKPEKLIPNPTPERTPTNQKEQQQQQQQQPPHQKRSTPAVRTNTASPPQKRLITKTSSGESSDMAIDKDEPRVNANDNLKTLSRAVISSNSSKPPQLPSPPSNPFQPPLSIKKYDPRLRKTCNK
ncbi:uncharacterized protein LOC129741754 [Uranotaenia lowii]|uniref:uncharacterized protein LOC129741754 n=1 Tax=Uranotaenia lowii TaxID=190385 RepID=UPI00247845CE|nr:uncharacterized protein LOC129741754 [Uranotaenia lowii]